MFTITKVEQPEVNPVQTFYGYFCDGPEGDPRIEVLGFPSYLSVEEAREKAIAHAVEHGFLNGFILMTAREIARVRSGYEYIIINRASNKG